MTKTPPPRDQRHTPPPGIRLMSGRYASYWNPFLFYFMFVKCRHVSLISLHIRNDALHIPVARNFRSKTRESSPYPLPQIMDIWPGLVSLSLSCSAIPISHVPPPRKLKFGQIWALWISTNPPPPTDIGYYLGYRPQAEVVHPTGMYVLLPLVVCRFKIRTGLGETVPLHAGIYTPPWTKARHPLRLKSGT